MTQLLSDYNRQALNVNNKIGGWGWRSQDSQINLRTKHCAGSDGVASHHDIWMKSASQCSPPTARPGTSSHQNGLAIDFYCGSGGSLSQCAGGATFRWLDSNAAQYGLINLPSEPWHWYFPES